MLKAKQKPTKKRKKFKKKQHRSLSFSFIFFIFTCNTVAVNSYLKGGGNGFLPENKTLLYNGIIIAAYILEDFKT